MAKKIVTALGIFSVIFVGSWWGNEMNEKRYYIDEKDDQVQSLMVGEELKFERFRPREYIKIKR